MHLEMAGGMTHDDTYDLHYLNEISQRDIQITLCDCGGTFHHPFVIRRPDIDVHAGGTIDIA
jgi:hypothetical protein